MNPQLSNPDQGLTAGGSPGYGNSNGGNSDSENVSQMVNSVFGQNGAPPAPSQIPVNNGNQSSTSQNCLANGFNYVPEGSTASSSQYNNNPSGGSVLNTQAQVGGGSQGEAPTNIAAQRAVRPAALLSSTYGTTSTSNAGNMNIPNLSLGGSTSTNGANGNSASTNTPPVSNSACLNTNNGVSQQSLFSSAVNGYATTDKCLAMVLAYQPQSDQQAADYFPKGVQALGNCYEMVNQQMQLSAQWAQEQQANYQKNQQNMLALMIQLMSQNH